MDALSSSLKTIRGSLSQAAFARILGISQQRYANYESGVRDPDLTTLCRIAQLTGKTTDELLGLKIVKQDKSTDKINDLKKAIITILKEY